MTYQKIAVNGKKQIIDVFLNPLDDLRARKILENYPKPIYPSTSDIWIYLVQNFEWDAILDVGANYGELAAQAFVYRKSANTPIYIFEPSISLRAPLRLTFGEKKNVFLYFNGLGDKNEYALFRNFYKNTGKSNFNSVDQNMEKFDVHREKIELRTLDSYNFNLSKILIKLDIEGFEPRALMGARRTIERTPEVVILMEANQIQWESLEWLNSFFDLFVLSRIKGKLVKVDFERLDQKNRKEFLSLYWHDVVLVKSQNPLTYTKRFISIHSQIIKILNWLSIKLKRD